MAPTPIVGHVGDVDDEALSLAPSSFMADPTAPDPSSLWDAAAMAATDDILTVSSSTAPTSLTADSDPPPSTAPSSAGLSSRRSQGHPPSTRPAQRRRTSDKKPQRLHPEPPLFESTDYWIQFDSEGAQGNSKSNPFLTEEDGEALRPKGSLAVTQGPAVVGASGARLGHADSIDDSALDNALSDDDEILSLGYPDLLAMPIPEAHGQADLSSATIRWGPMQLTPRPGSMVFVQSPTLSKAEQQRLMATALGRGQRISGSDIATTTMSQVTNSAPQPRPTPQRRTSKSSLGDDKTRPGERTAHNDIERKYRTNLKDKIAELRDAVPSLKAIPELSQDEGEPQPAPKVSKGTVLTKATEYIRQLERRNKQATREHQELSKKLDTYEQLLNPSVRSAFRNPMDQ